MQPGEITRVLREGYDAQRLTEGLRELVDQLDLDVLFIDTHPGLNEETLLSLVISDALLIVMRPDKQDFEGTGITVRVAKELEVPRISIVVNKTPTDSTWSRSGSGGQHLRLRCRRRAPHSDDLMRLATEGVFVLRHPEHPLTEQYRRLAAHMVPDIRP